MTDTQPTEGENYILLPDGMTIAEAHRLIRAGMRAEAEVQEGEWLYFPENMSLDEAQRRINGPLVEMPIENVPEAPRPSFADITRAAERAMQAQAAVNDITRAAQQAADDERVEAPLPDGVPPLSTYIADLGRFTTDQMIRMIRELDGQLQGEANRRGWCSDYERVIRVMNRRVGARMLHGRFPIAEDMPRPRHRHEIVVRFDADAEYSPPTEAEALDMIRRQAGMFADSVTTVRFNTRRI